MVKLLVVDADDIYAEALSTGLRSAGHQLQLARDAQTAVDILDDDEGVDIVITELQLPEHNGLALLQHLQSYADWQQLPIIVLSQLRPEQFELSAASWRQYGVVEYFYKPKLDPQELNQRITEVLGAASAS